MPLATSSFEARCETLPGERASKLGFVRHGMPLGFADVLRLWQTDPSFCWFFSRQLAAAPYAAFFWETPPLTLATVDRPFECVLVDSPQLAAVTADRRAFDEYFSGNGREGVAVFPNIGHDAWLIAPVPVAAAEIYPHLATFVRRGPPSQQQAFWGLVGATVTGQLSGRPLWLSTSGLGVYWLHVRVDTVPKYYTWQPYKRPGN